MVVVERKVPFLFGRDWLTTVKLDWFKVYCTSNDGKPKLLVEKYKEDFTEYLDTMTQHVAGLIVLKTLIYIYLLSLKLPFKLS